MQGLVMNIGMIDVHNSNYDSIYKLSEPLKRAYCEKHGYQFVEYIADIPLVPDTRQDNWSRVQGIICNLHRFDWLFYLDTDLLIMNDTHKIEHWIDEKYNMIVGPLPHEGHIMTSGMLIKNCRWSYEFFLDMYAQTRFISDPYYSPENTVGATGNPCTGGYYWEQSSFHFLYDTKPNYKDKIKLVERRHFNSETKSYKDGDFLIHFPGQLSKTKLMKAMLEKGHKQVVDKAGPVDGSDYLKNAKTCYEKIQARKKIMMERRSRETDND